MFHKVHIYNDPPSTEEVRAMAERLPNGVADLIGVRSQPYRNLGLAGKNLTDLEWLKLIEEEPRLLRRPILTDGTTVIVGFNEKAYENVAAAGKIDR